MTTAEKIKALRRGMRYTRIVYSDQSHGPGRRTTVFVAKPGTGEPYDFDVFCRILDSIQDGLSILGGGDPFGDDNVWDVAILTMAAKEEDKSIWVYTGYAYEEVADMTDPASRKILANADVLVDGDGRVIDLAQTTKRGEVVLWQSLTK